MNTIGICLNTENFAPSQYSNFNFNSMCVFNDKVLCAGESGIFEHSGTSDNSTVITSYFQLPSSNFDTSQQKKFRKLYLSGYISGEMAVTVITDEDTASVVYTGSMTADNVTYEVPLNYTDNGEFVGVKIANVNGADFSIDSIQAAMVVTIIPGKTSKRVGRCKFNFTTVGVSASGS